MSMPQIDVADIVRKAKAFLDCRRHHIALLGSSGYYYTLQNSPELHRIGGTLLQALRFNCLDDSVADVYCQVLRDNVNWLLVQPDDPPALAAVEQAVAALQDLAARRCEDAAALAATGSKPDPPPPLVDDKTPAAPVILGKPGDEPTVNGRTKPRLTGPRYDVVKALLSAGNDGLSHESLVRKSGHGDARRILKRLADSDNDWSSVIQMAGDPGGRYRILTKNLLGPLRTSTDLH
jgi:hypothetical protein